ncbi:MAG: hypothetical protein KTR32_02870 [Granulosicoccus sp.]|nr:hypothetical protein [Granulosicoccus sp.]
MSEDVAPSVIDVEASGFGCESYPIEVGVVLSCGKRLSMLIQPEPQWSHWDTKAQALHGLSRDLLFQSGHSAMHVAHTFNQLLKGQTVYSDAWVVDKPWIDTLFYQARVPLDFHVSPIEQIMHESQFAVWDQTKQELIAKLSNANRHRASIDAWIIQQTFLSTRIHSDTVGR